MFWSLSMPKPVEQMEKMCRSVASDRMHFIAVSPDEADKLEKLETFAKTVKVRKQPLTLPFAADSTGKAFDNFMFQHGEHGIPHAFVIGTDGVIVWHGHPARPALIDNLREVVKSLPPRASPAGKSSDSKAIKEGKKKA